MLFILILIFMYIKSDVCQVLYIIKVIHGHIYNYHNKYENKVECPCLSFSWSTVTIKKKKEGK